MHTARKIVTEIPLGELWNSERVLEAKRGTYLTKDTISHLLKTERVAFAVANIGDELKWINPAECYSFWKEVKAHVTDHPEHIDLDSFPDHYTFIGSRWSADPGSTIILLERIH